MPSVLLPLVVGLAVRAGPPSDASSPAPEPAVTAETATAPLDVRTDRVDADAVARGLELRVGPRWRAWSIEIDDAADPDAVRVRLSASDGRIEARELRLTTTTREDRSRELASALALLVDQLDAPSPSDATPPEPEPTPTPTPASEGPSGWLGVGPRGAINPGSKLHPEIGAGLLGGAWLVRGHLQPVAELSWVRSITSSLHVDAVRTGAGLLGGAPVARGRMWVGAGVLVRAQWARATASRSTDGWWASPAAFGAVQYRGRILVAGAWLGVDVLLPPLRAQADGATLRWAPVRPMLALSLGLRLPPRVSRPR